MKLARNIVIVCIGLFLTAMVAAITVPSVIVALLAGTGYDQASRYEPPLPPPGMCIDTPGELPTIVPQPMNSIFTQAGKEYNVDPTIIAIVYYIEQGKVFREPPPPYGDGDPYATSPKSASGPFQFIPETWEAYRQSNPAGGSGDIQDLTDASFAASHFLADLGATNGTSFGVYTEPNKRPSIINALASYNAGPAGDFSNDETRDYLATAAEIYFENFYEFDPEDRGTEPEVDPCEAIPMAPPGDGYPDTANIPCAAGVSQGVFVTAKGNEIRVCKVQGITINTSMSAQLNNLLNEAEKSGFNFTGYGFRSLGDQVAVRKRNCGSSQYAIYEMPSGQCSPRTAIPGTSEHEQALAVDFGEEGFSIQSYSSPEHLWLAANGKRFNFLPLKSGDEAWHFSLTGR